MRTSPMTLESTTTDTVDAEKRVEEIDEDKSDISKITVAEKLIQGIEKLAQVQRSLMWGIAKLEKISPMQMQLVQFLHINPEERRRVSVLASEFDLTKPTVSDAVKTLERKKLVERRRFRGDARVRVLSLTASGAALAERVSSWSDPLLKQLTRLSPQISEQTLEFTMDILTGLKNDGVINTARMCLACKNFQRDVHPDSESPHHCGFLDKPMTRADLNMNCQGHDPR